MVQSIRQAVFLPFDISPLGLVGEQGGEARFYWRQEPTLLTNCALGQFLRHDETGHVRLHTAGPTDRVASAKRRQAEAKVLRLVWGSFDQVVQS